MTYQTAPWRLEGYAIQTLHLVDIKQAVPFVPSELEIVSLFPGKTLAGTYVSSYQAGSLLEYNELIVVPAFVRYQGHIGAWISHIYVDHEDSVAGGREIWGLPKEMAEFSWDNHGKVSVRQNQKNLYQLCYKKGLLSLSTWWQQEFRGNAFGGLGSELLYFQNNFKSQISFLKANLEIPQHSPFASLSLGQPWLTLNLQKLELVAGVPKLLGNEVINLSYG
ncbi:acetoacetate decarboxylase family protein [Anabaena cylindrica FACHB-243]|uniref:Acetoacetate decarboxylase n=1 Tax=Anabaena cylindrica (strain ATCC 27899 / PCC 7122) TaxID=272123 RepID=K9ZMZ7_ANACC|nr:MULTISPECIES: acetoacetate decarboxylase family protein [Anabaena]AFZ59922.1 Acetoacetate decarboxylase [Anabaena cylindrica PCC 7122]MBD2416753.1 acetoacetate decarboxylase family protein [Anabaena cylindrica FACHB-243]MBY5285341.1 acetoacetate decarboxylase family protein [Anabaena sp. CCAP 1446/1C]MBY5308696.1 acetoacetate decarboxylase family protein [Anabaena sp. CCAP 1446/1C]MCM2409828.1 acetoacetate decarboxylase family protein [Anabaena sp. CCAP 1446/1C]